MNGDIHAQDLSRFLDDELYPALWACLDTAFPEFGFQHSDSAWVAGRKELTRRLPGSPHPKDVRALRHVPFGFFAGDGEFVPWADYVGGDDYPTVLQRLSERAAVSLPPQEFSEDDLKRAEKQDRRARLLESFVIICRDLLAVDDGAPGRVVLEDQGFTPAQIEDLDVGFYTSPSGICAAMEAKGFSAAEVEAAGLKANWWTNRIVGPWRNRAGRIVNVWGRRLDASTMIAESDSRIQQVGPIWVFQSNGSKDSPFGLDQARGRDLVLVNSLFDVLALRQAGFTDVVSLAGAPMGPEQLHALVTARVKSLTLNLDYDPREDPCEIHSEMFCLRCFPGFRMTLHALDQLTRSVLVVSVVDPCQMSDMNDISEPVSPRRFLRLNSMEAYGDLIKSATRGQVFRADTILRDYDLSNDKGRESAIQALLQYDAILQDERDRKAFWTRAAEATGYSYAFLYSQAQSRAGRRERENIERELSLLIDDARRDLDENRTTPEGLVTEMSERLDGLRSRIHHDRPEPFSVDGLVDSIKNAGEGKFSGWTALDRVGIRFHPAELAVMGSRTGHGKSTVLISLLLNWLETYPNETFILYSYEVPPDAVMTKMASALTRKFGGKGWTYYGIRSRLRRYDDAPQEGIAQLDKAFEALRAWEDRLHVIYRPTWTIEDLCAHARQVSEHAGRIGGILVDYLQLVPPPAGQSDRPNAEVSEVARRLKILAVDLACPVVSAVQIGRESIEDRAIPVTGKYMENQIQAAIRARSPQLHHLRGSGCEQAADLVLGLQNFRADFLGERQILDAEERGKPSRLEFLVLKNRYGGLGTAALVLEGWTSTIRDREKDGEI